jgi:hypothetical protein
MISKETIVVNFTEVKEILQSQIFAVLNDPDYPMTIDLMEISKAKSLLEDVEILLNPDRVVKIMPNSDTNVQECDATGDASST